MSRINVKIATTKLIETLETKCLEFKELVKNYDAIVAQAHKDREAREEIILAEAVKLASTAKYSSSYDRGEKLQVTLVVNLPRKTVNALPPEPSRQSRTVYDLNRDIEEIENAIRILKLTDQTEVNTSTYNSVARFL